MDREAIFKIVNNREWRELINLFKDNDVYAAIQADEILQPLIRKYFITELLTNTLMQNDSEYKYCLENFYSLHTVKNYLFKLSDEDFKRLVVRIVGIEKDINLAYNYAKHFPDEPSCELIIAEFDKNKALIINHSQENNILVTQNANIQQADATVSIFKSNQEYTFFKCVREVFPMYMVLPNVALNAVIDYELIKNNLSPEERSFFFKGLIDCVVLDTENSFRPIRFIELDSSLHDNKRQKQNDGYKDNILAKAGQKLYRVRSLTVHANETDFIKLIKEALK